MIKIHKIILAIALCVSMQAFALKIKFDSSTYGKSFRVFIFKNKSDYDGMVTQVGILNKVTKLIGVVTPLVGQMATAAVSAKTKESTASVDYGEYSFEDETDQKKTEPYYSKTEIAAINASISAASDIMKEVAKSNFAERLTYQGYSVVYQDGFKPTASNHTICFSAEKLAKPLYHKVKSNDNVFLVIYDETSGKVFFEDWGRAYGDFIFSIETLFAADSIEKALVGKLTEISAEGGKTCR